MPYSQGRVVHDADAHIMETPTWLRDHAEAAYRDRLPVLRYPGGNELRQTGDPAAQQREIGFTAETLMHPRRAVLGEDTADMHAAALRESRCRPVQIQLRVQDRSGIHDQCGMRASWADCTSASFSAASRTLARSLTLSLLS